MGKVIKFQSKNDSSQENNANAKAEESKIQSVFGISEFEKSLRDALEDYIKYTFAVKNILGMDLIYKKKKSTIGILGAIAYEHKRRPGTFLANFIAEAVDEKNSIRIIEVAFEAGEPDLYRNIYNTLKAKKALPEIFV